MNSRRAILSLPGPIVVKVGTRSLTHEDGRLDESRIQSIADQTASLIEAGRQVALVSSGAVGAGIGRLGLARRPSDLAQLQAVAALGQSALLEAYNRVFETHGLQAAQILLTADDLQDRTRYLNIRNTLSALFEYGAVPIINENDTVRVYELERHVGDNDRLAGMVANLIQSPLLILLTDVPGVYTGPPNEAGSKLLSEIDFASEDFSVNLESNANKKLQLSVGGMADKLSAAKAAAMTGVRVIIASGDSPNVLPDILSGQPIGTLCYSSAAPVIGRKRWIGWSARPAGKIMLDAGASVALTEKGSSLLAVGIESFSGVFEKGDVVSILDAQKNEFARGLTNYSSNEVGQIMGQPPEVIVFRLGHQPYDTVIHRNNLVLL